MEIGAARTTRTVRQRPAGTGSFLCVHFRFQTVRDGQLRGLLRAGARTAYHSGRTGTNAACVVSFNDKARFDTQRPTLNARGIELPRGARRFHRA